ncbi:nucleoside triphosphate pyrophosphohydrolase family protein [Methylomicrobium sp. Wu6]|uniref:nucleoside triphosphate pyrophosphohydrolase family protein n=1 Tax=Methylomicrobium sp. Wu6 TaxID=3107928 RepID=UPI002DD6367A|nr:nucleoside triphosphate pyrophosphohydrolase family protein [Methylomicrobium sp. Wu6]MEC4750187.1 nucleoside triphosphate pyrophosphohydrolase family protein [Methylomicrobium sp. Wu6]
MNKHLQLVREFREKLDYPAASGHVSDMHIVLRQAWLMDAGKQALLAIKQGDMAKILTRLTALVYLALNAIAEQGCESEVDKQPVFWRHDGTVLSLMRLISERINACSSGRCKDYSELYCVTAQITSSFLNADFDKAFSAFHQHQLETGTAYGLEVENQGEVDWRKLPDLSDCLYE